MSAINLESVQAQPQAERTPVSITWWDVWVLILPLVAMLPMLLFQFQALMSRPERQFTPLMILAAFFFPLKSIWEGRGSTSETPLTLWRLRMSLTALGCSLMIFIASVWWFSPWLAQVGAIVLFVAWALGRCQADSWSSVLAWAGLLLVTVPLPLNRDTDLIGWLQSSSSWACSVSLDALSVPNFRLANVIEVKDRQLFVEEACSGIGSMYALLAAAALLLLINGRSLAVAVSTLLSVPVWAMLGNFLRLLTIALAQVYYERDLSHGFDHELLGTLTFLVAAGGLWMTEWMLANLLQPIPPTAPEVTFMFQTLNAAICWPNKDPFANIVDNEHDSPEERKAREAAEAAALAEKAAKVVWLRPRSVKWARISIHAIAAIALLVAIPPTIVLSRGSPKEVFSFNLPEFSEPALAKFPSLESMPEYLGAWKRTAFRPETRSNASFFGAHSRIWEYRSQGNELLLSIDFPFRGPHPLQLCYSSTGWKVESNIVQQDADDGWPWTELIMRNDFGTTGIVCYATLTEEGTPYLAHEESVLEGKAAHGIVRALGTSRSFFEPVCYQFQLLYESGSKLTPEERADVHKQFLAARKYALAEIASLRTKSE